ncbi:MAG: hypothetical protein CMC67_03330 [Flavobacteriaceae bacterium]|nr:hypothetical protein [Flavobacteriaceae bacterium]|tara:strand:- start:49 stop:270 length:222 start_codon:yes stop_codon:yes gene_type:complete
MNNKSTFLIAASIIISALLISLSNRYKPSSVNESFVIDSWTGDIFDIQGNNLTDIHENISPEINNPVQTDKIQ